MAEQDGKEEPDEEEEPDERFLSWRIYLEPSLKEKFILTCDVSNNSLILSQESQLKQKYSNNDILSTNINNKNNINIILTLKSKKQINIYFDSEYDCNQLNNVINYCIKGKIKKKAKKFGLFANYELGCQKKTVMKWQPRVMSLVQHRMLLFKDKDNDSYPCNVISLADPKISIHQAAEYPITIQLNTSDGNFAQYYLGDQDIMNDLNEYIDGVLNKVNKPALKSFDKSGTGKNIQQQQSQQQFGNMQQQQGTNMNFQQQNNGSNMNFQQGSNINMNQQQYGSNINMQQQQQQFQNPYNMNQQSQMSMGQSSQQLYQNKNTNVNYGSEMNINKQSNNNNNAENSSQKPKLSPLAFTQKYKRKKAVLYMWGKAHPANIYPENSDRLQPYEHESLTKKKIYYACAAKEGHTAFGIGQNDWLFCWGQTKHGGALGLGNKNKTSTPFLVRALKKMKIFTVACASSHGFCIDTNGKVYGWGSKKLTILQQDSVAPTIVPQLQNLNINNIVCCDTHNVGWNPESIKVYSWGIPGSWLGLGDNSQEKNIVFGLMEFDDEIKNNDQFAITHCSISSQYTLVLLNTGYVGACGINEYGRMASGKDIQESWSVLWNPDIKDIVHCSAGPFHAAFCDTKGNCYTVGQGKDYRCSSSNKTTYKPILVDQIEKVRIVRVECSDSRTYVVSSEGHLIMWGKEPVTGRIHANPFYFEYLSAYRIYDIICAADFNIAIANPSKSPIARPDLKEIEVDSSIHTTKDTNNLNAMIANVVETGHQIGTEKQFKVDQIFGGFVSVTKDIPDPDQKQSKQNQQLQFNNPNDPMAQIMAQMQGMGLNSNGSQMNNDQFEQKQNNQMMQQQQQKPMNYGYQQPQQQQMGMGRGYNPNMMQNYQGSQQNFNMNFNGNQQNVFQNQPNNMYGSQMGFGRGQPMMYGSQQNMNMGGYGQQQQQQKPPGPPPKQNMGSLGNNKVFSNYKKPKIQAAPNPFK